MASLQNCTLEVDVTFADGSVANLKGYRMTADIAKNGVPAMNTADIRIYGLDPSLMNSLTNIGVTPAINNNIVRVLAGTDPSALSLAYAGVIAYAWADLEPQPETAFNITAMTSYLDAVKPVPSKSFPGPTDVAVIMGQLANEMGYTLENDGVKGIILSSPYFPGTARQQAISAATAAGILVVFDDENEIMAILPKDGSRTAFGIPLIAPPPDGTMIGYPSYVGPGQIRVRSQYNPNVRFMGNVQIQSSITAAAGLWRVTQLTHNLSTQLPNGDWATEIIGNRLLASSSE